MAEKPIVLYGDQVLREVSKKVEKIDQETKDLVSDMADALKSAQGLGLAAIQVGVPKRLFIVDLSAVDITETLRVFINPEILSTSDSVELEEGCLSFPGIYQKIVRPANVKVRATDIDGKESVMEFGGLAARCVLHEYDHLEGKLFIDYLSALTKTMIAGRLKKLAAS